MKHFVRTLAKFVITEAATAFAASAASEAGSRIIARLLPCDEDTAPEKPGDESSEDKRKLNSAAL